MIAIIFSIISIAFSKGYSQFSYTFFTANDTAGAGKSGIFFQIVGTITLLATAVIITAPAATAIMIVEYTIKNKKGIRALQTALHLLNGTPSILFGIIGFIFFVKILDLQKSWFSGGCILAIMILPTVTIAMITRLRTIPKDYLATARSLGLTEDALILRFILPYTKGGLLTGLVMGIARAAGETAPIMFTAVVFFGATWPKGIHDSPVLALPYHIFNLAQDMTGADAIPKAWATAATLLLLVFAISIIAAPIRAKSHEEANQG